MRCTEQQLKCTYRQSVRGCQRKAAPLCANDHPRVWQLVRLCRVDGPWRITKQTAPAGRPRRKRRQRYTRKRMMDRDTSAKECRCPIVRSQIRCCEGKIKVWSATERRRCAGQSSQTARGATSSGRRQWKVKKYNVNRDACANLPLSQLPLTSNWPIALLL